jgi:predicted MPP superfamily phosphohydrolase
MRIGCAIVLPLRQSVTFCPLKLKVLEPSDIRVYVAITMWLFFLSVLVIYLSCCGYAVWKGRNAVSKKPKHRIIYALIFSFIFLLYPVMRVVENFIQAEWVWGLLWLGAVGLGFGFYTLLGLIIMDITRIVFSLLGNWVLWFEMNVKNVRRYGPMVVWAVALALTVHGVINAQNPVVRHVRIQLFKDFPDRKELRVAAVSDIHIGSLIREDRVEKLVNMVNDLQPDIILLLGDVIDEDAGMVIKKDWGRSLRSLQAPLGVYAVVGNHEYYSHVDACTEYLTQHYIRVLRDETAKIANSFYLVGREDFARTMMLRDPRASIKSLLGGVDKDLPIIVMDHQPRGWRDAVEAGVDVYLAGHTHAGQLWPLHHLTRLIFGVRQGFKALDQTSIFISNGFGTWGPPMRVGNRPDIVLFTLVGG